MSIKPILFAFLLLFSIPFCSSAQKFKVTWGDNSRIKDEFDDAVPLRNGKYIVLKTTTAVAMFSRGPASPKLLLIDKSMVQQKEMELGIDERLYDPVGLKVYGGNVFYVYNAYDRGDKTTTVYALHINENTLATTQKINLGTYESDSRNDQADVTYKLSADSSKLLLFVEGPDKKKDNKKFFLTVYNTDLKALWKRDVELAIPDRYVSIYDQDVTDDGKVYVAIKHYEKEVSRESVREDGDKIPSYQYKLLVYADASSKEREIAFNLNEQFIQGTKLIYNPNGSVTVAGLYKKKPNRNVTGAFFTTFQGDATEVSQPRMVPFPDELLTQIDKDGFAKDNGENAGLYRNFRIRHILYRDNGSVDLVSEYYKHISETYTDPSTHMIRYRELYYSGDILDINLPKSGEPIFNRIPKDQSMEGSDLFLGYFPIVYKDKLVLLYCDEEDNLDRDLAKAPRRVFRFKKSSFIAATIDDKGTLTRQEIYSHRDEDYVSMPTSTVRISDNKYLVVSDLFKLLKRRTRFGVLEIR